ncbi:MAG: hypothetical protein U0Q15_06175 [Kineosporiaceae bacterium]
MITVRPRAGGHRRAPLALAAVAVLAGGVLALPGTALAAGASAGAAPAGVSAAYGAPSPVDGTVAACDRPAARPGSGPSGSAGRSVSCFARWKAATPLTAARRAAAARAALASASRAGGTGAAVGPQASPSPSPGPSPTPEPIPLPTKGLRPADIAAIYALDPAKGAGATLAIVDAYDNPNVESDLAVYRAALGLAPCTSATKCFRKVNQRGGAQAPEADPGWGVEIALDVQAVSAACPACKILLVEADDPQLENMGAAAKRAATLGATVISHSYGIDEFTGADKLGAAFYGRKGVPDVASSGDYGFTAASFPAVLPSSIAVGGTRVTKRADGTWAHVAWAGAGSGCSAWFAKPAWQKDTHCSMRTTSDVSAVADPRSGLAVYDTFGLGAANGWIVVGAPACRRRWSRA